MADNLPANMMHLGFLRFSADEEGGPDGSKIQLLRVGRWNHPKYGPIVINEKTLDDIVCHFNENVRGVELAIDTEHKADKGAKGWIRNVYKSPDGTRLYSDVEWTPKGEEMIKMGEYKYISAEYSPLYTDTENGTSYKNVLVGAALTNRPFIKNMDPVLLSEDVIEDVVADLDLYMAEETEDDGSRRVYYDPETVKFSHSYATPKEKYDSFREELKREVQAERTKREELEHKIKLMEVQGEVDTLIRKEGRVLPKDRETVTRLLAELPEDQANNVRSVLYGLPKKLNLSEIGSRIAPTDRVKRQPAFKNPNNAVRELSEDVQERLDKKAGKLNYRQYREELKRAIKDDQVEEEV